MRRFTTTLTILIFGSASALADVIPSRPTPPPPGPAKAVVRGISVSQSYGYWQGRKWLVTIDGCTADTQACQGVEFAGCLVTGVNNQPVRGVGALIAADESAGAEPIKLQLENCGRTEIELTK